MARKQNKGEWSEIYAFAKILSERKIYAADGNVNKIPDLFFSVQRVIREESKQRKIYSFLDNQVQIDLGDLFSQNVDISEINALLPVAFKQIKEGKNAFPSPACEELMALLGCEKVTAGSRKKEDINLAVHDVISKQSREAGFSIKSELGSAATMFNASQQTNFVYEVKGYNGSLEEVNNIDTRTKVQDRIKKIEELSGVLHFDKMQSPTFEKNIRKVDSFMPIILAEFLKVYFRGQATTITNLSRIVAESEAIQELNMGFGYEDIKFKIKNLLLHMSLGMVAATVWDGNLKAGGGYLIVTNDGEVLCFHIHNIMQFSDYLYERTKLETPSIRRMKCAELFDENGKLFFKLSLQVRFASNAS